jgi:hypothetical protein
VNLLANAVKFTERGEVEVRVTAEPVEGDQLRILTSVRDTGVVVDTGGTYPPILCPLLGTPIPVTCRSRNGLPPCCGLGGICFCEQSSPFGPLCLPCN